MRMLSFHTRALPKVTGAEKLYTITPQSSPLRFRAKIFLGAGSLLVR
jgi:hypothetical protein